METAFSEQTRAGLAAGAWLSEKPHQGVAAFAPTLHQGIAYSKPLSASGLPVCLYDSDRRSRCTGKERDAETGLDYFLARYYSPAQGRFTSPDEFTGGIVDPFTGQQVGEPGPLPYADITDPQTLNKYAYVRNNPLRYIDPDGHALIDWLRLFKKRDAATGTGVLLLNDGVRRGQYQSAAQGAMGRASRNLMKVETRGQLSPIGQALSEAADKSRSLAAGNSPTKTSELWNAAGKSSKVAGGALLAVGVASSAVEVASAPEGQRARVAAGEVGAFGLSLGGALAGAKLFGSIGSLAGPWGGAAGALVGSAVGGMAGGKGGRDIGTKAYDALTEENK